MQTRSPENISPELEDDYLWKVSGTGAAEPNDLPIGEATVGQAWGSSGTGGMQINVGLDLTDDDPVWENAPGGGIRLKL